MGGLRTHSSPPCSPSSASGSITGGRASLLLPIRPPRSTPAATAGKARSLPHPRQGTRPVARGFWRGSPTWSCAHPVAVAWCPASPASAGRVPLGQIHLAEANVTLLPPRDDARQGTELLVKVRPGQRQSTWCSTSTDQPYSAPMWPSPTSSPEAEHLPRDQRVTSYVNVSGLVSSPPTRGCTPAGLAGCPRRSGLRCPSSPHQHRRPARYTP